MTDREQGTVQGTTGHERGPWTTPDLIEANISTVTGKPFSSTVELYVPTFDRHLGPTS